MTQTNQNPGRIQKILAESKKLSRIQNTFAKSKHILAQSTTSGQNQHKYWQNQTNIGKIQKYLTESSKSWQNQQNNSGINKSWRNLENAGRMILCCCRFQTKFRVQQILAESKILAESRKNEFAESNIYRQNAEQKLEEPKQISAEPKYILAKNNQNIFEAENNLKISAS